jgi:hypothetical protein
MKVIPRARGRVVRRRLMTRNGWRIRRIEICG